MFERDEAVRAVEQMLYDLEHHRDDKTLTVWEVLASGPPDRNISRAITDAVIDVFERMTSGDPTPELVRRAHLLMVLAGEEPIESLDP